MFDPFYTLFHCNTPGIFLLSAGFLVAFAIILLLVLQCAVIGCLIPDDMLRRKMMKVGLLLVNDYDSTSDSD